MVCTLAVLFPPIGSDGLVTTTVLAIVPAARGRTTMVTVTDDPVDMAPRAHVTMAVPAQLPWLGVAETKSTPDGRVSVATTSSAASGPALDTTIV